MKKTFRNVTAIFLAVLIAFSYICSYADSENDTTIIFCIGDDTLNINGNNVKVEKPYVVGEGVTLVPLRVITEAFGADVNWIESTQSIELSYPGTKITLQIGNPIAEVNQKAQVLLSAPELTGDYTMVPLRFISETFGAKVTYDEQTEKVTVTKTASDTGSIIQSGISYEYIGDSYWKWFMENPANSVISYRNFDGSITGFTADNKNTIMISITSANDNYDIDEDFESAKNSLQDATLVKAEKDTSNPDLKTAHLQARNKDSFFDLYTYVTPQLLFTVSANMSNDDTDAKNRLIAALSTFKCEYSDSANTYDLSNDDNGYREFKSDDLGFSFKIPSEYYLLGSEEVENSLLFLKSDNKDTQSHISFNIYSKGDDNSAQNAADNDLEFNKKTINNKLAKFSSVVQKNYAGIPCFEYTISFNSQNNKSFIRDVFFEIGNYIYNMSITAALPVSNTETIMDTILNSIKAQEIDYSRVGDLLKTDRFSDETFTSLLFGVNLVLPRHYTKVSILGNENSLGFINNITGSSMMVTVLKSNNASVVDSEKYIMKIENNAKSENLDICNKTYVKEINGVKHAMLVLSKHNDDKTTTYYMYASCVRGDRFILYSMEFSDEDYSEYSIDEFYNIIGATTLAE